MAAINCNFAHALKFDPDQPRAADGKWTGGGGGGSAMARADAAHFAAHPSEDPKNWMGAFLARPVPSGPKPPVVGTQMPLGSFGKTGPHRPIGPQMSFAGSLGRMGQQARQVAVPNSQPRVSQLVAFKPMEPGGDLHAKPMRAPFQREAVGGSSIHENTEASAEAERQSREASADASAENNWQNGEHERPFYLQRARFQRDLTDTNPSTPGTGTTTRERRQQDDEDMDDRQNDEEARNDRAEEFASNADLESETPEPTLALGATPIEQHLGKSQLSSIRSIGGGISETHLVQFDDGSKGIFKPEDGEYGGARSLVDDGTPVEREVASYKTAQLAGMGDIVSPTVERTIDGRRGSMADYVPGDDAKHFHGDEKYDGDRDAARAAVFDYVIGNQDRHGGNWRYNPDGSNSEGGDGKLTLIDHNLTFPDADDYITGSSHEANTAIFDHGSETGHSPGEFAEGFVNNKDKILAMLEENGISSSAREGVGLRIDRLAKASSFQELGDDDWDHTAESSASGSASQPGWASPSGNHTVGGGLRGQALLDALANGDPTHPQQQESRFGNKNPNGGPPADNREKPGQLTWDNMNTSNWFKAGMPTRPLHDARFPTPVKPAAKPAGALTAWEAMTHGAWVKAGRPPRPKNPKGTVGGLKTVAPDPKPIRTSEWGDLAKPGNAPVVPKQRPTLDYADSAFGHSLERHQAANPGRGFSANIASVRAANGGVMTRARVIRARAAGLGLEGRDMMAREALAHISPKHSFKPS